MNFAELSEKYPTQSLQHYRRCIIVPGAEFDPDWEADLDEESYRCIYTDIEGAPVVLVPHKTVNQTHAIVKKRLERLRENGVITTHSNGYLEVKKTVKKQGWAAKWTAEEDKRLLEIVGGVRFAVNRFLEPCLAEFPGRTLEACLWRVGYLRKQKKKAEAAAAVQISTNTSSVTAPVAQAYMLQEQKIAELEKSVAVLQETFSIITDSCAELRRKLEGELTRLQKEIDNVAGLTPSQDEVDELQEKLAKHKHAVSGEAMQPMEVS